MILWTIQPAEIYELIRREGVYRCDPERCPDSYLFRSYDWLAEKMGKKIGPPPEGVIYPVWAWYRHNGKHRKPDLRSARWDYGEGGKAYVCMELSLSRDRVVLSDFDDWHCILNDFLISYSEEEYDALEKTCEPLPESKKRAFKDRNRMRVFNIRRLENDWTPRGRWVQATFWELRREDIRKVRHFITAGRAE